MKLQLKTVIGILLPAVLAGSAAAQAVRILPSGPGIGAPIYFPGPVTGPTAQIKIELPSPRLNPGLTVTLAPVVMGVFPALPMPMIPDRPIIPAIRPIAVRENVAHPLAPILPGLKAQLSEVDKKNDWKKEIGDGLFDGRLIPERKPVVEPSDRPAPVRPGRQISLPEADLEREIGAY